MPKDATQEAAKPKYYFEHKEGKDGKTYWAFKSGENGKTLATGEGHRDMTDALRAMRNTAEAMKWVLENAQSVDDPTFFRKAS